VLEIGASDLICANLEQASLQELKNFAKKRRLKRAELPFDVLDSAQSVDTSWVLLDANIADVNDWYKKRNSLFEQGRGKAISDKTCKQVWYAAAGRCMFRGCGQDLGRTTLTTKVARIAYLAHIIASDPDGPRGNASDSHRLSDESENIMLMCDAHHRLIDRIDVDEYPVDKLNVMRQEHVQQVNYLLNSLVYPHTQIVTLFSNLAQVTTTFPQKQLQESVLKRKLNPLFNIFNAIQRTQRDDRNRPDFWNHFLFEHELGIRNFILQVGSQPNYEKLAIFPLHLVPVLVIAGRIVGEAQPVELFQYDRNRCTWCWDDSAIPCAQGNISISSLPTSSVDEVFLSIELTANVDEQALPTELAAIPRIRITHSSQRHDCIRCSEDLEQFTNIARDVVQVIQDQIRAKKVHLIGIAPASTLFRFGQLLQAGHHPVYQIYDRPSGNDIFQPALSISGTQIIAHSDNNEPFSISLR
jgi:hypothetical protein